MRWCPTLFTSAGPLAKRCLLRAEAARSYPDLFFRSVERAIHRALGMEPDASLAESRVDAKVKLHDWLETKWNECIEKPRDGNAAFMLEDCQRCLFLEGLLFVAVEYDLDAKSLQDMADAKSVTLCRNQNAEAPSC